jgi:hypothetical protein
MSDSVNYVAEHEEPVSHATDPTIDELQCMICHETILDQVRNMCDSAHIACTRCARKLIDTTLQTHGNLRRLLKCPVCRKSTRLDPTCNEDDPLPFINVTLQRFIERNVHVRCDADGCDWIGPVMTSREHSNTCGYHIVECDICHDVYKRSDADEHDEKNTNRHTHMTSKTLGGMIKDASCMIHGLRTQCKELKECAHNLQRVYQRVETATIDHMHAVREIQTRHNPHPRRVRRRVASPNHQQLPDSDVENSSSSGSDEEEEWLGSDVPLTPASSVSSENEADTQQMGGRATSRTANAPLAAAAAERRISLRARAR